MTRPRSSLVSPDVTRYYHCITKCVRQAFLLQSGKTDRKKWLRNRLREVSEVYAVSVSAFGIMDNHFHLVLRLDVEIANSWSDWEVIERWARLHPPKKNRKPIEISKEWLLEQTEDKEHVEKIRKRLCNLGWFMKEVKEPLARLCNQEDNHNGTFFEGRFKSIAILDEQALLATCIYVDLNPFAAGLASAPELSVNVSLFERIAHAKSLGRVEDLARAQHGSALAVEKAGALEDELWLNPIEDRRHLGSRREGMIRSFTLGNYLLVLDAVARRPRDGKAHLSQDVLGIFERLAFDVEFWLEQQLRDHSAKLIGCFFASAKEKLHEAAEKLGLHHCCNLTERPEKEVTKSDT